MENRAPLDRHGWVLERFRRGKRAGRAKDGRMINGQWGRRRRDDRRTMDGGMIEGRWTEETCRGTMGGRGRLSERSWVIYTLCGVCWLKDFQDNVDKSTRF